MNHPSRAQVADSQSAAVHVAGRHPRPTFTITCWLLALIAFAQLITVGTALAVRSGQAVEVTQVQNGPSINPSQEPIQPRSLAEILASVADGPSEYAHAPLRVATPARSSRPTSPWPSSARAWPSSSDAATRAWRSSAPWRTWLRSKATTR